MSILYIYHKLYVRAMPVVRGTGRGIRTLEKGNANGGISELKEVQYCKGNVKRGTHTCRSSSDCPRGADSEEGGGWALPLHVARLSHIIRV